MAWWSNSYKPIIITGEFLSLGCNIDTAQILGAPSAKMTVLYEVIDYNSD